MPLEIFDDASSWIVERSATEDSHLIMSFSKWLKTTVSNSKIDGLFESQMGIWFWFSRQILEQHLQQLRRATFGRHFFGVCFSRLLCSLFRFYFHFFPRNRLCLNCLRLQSVWTTIVFGPLSRKATRCGQCHSQNQTDQKRSDENASTEWNNNPKNWGANRHQPP